MRTAPEEAEMDALSLLTADHNRVRGLFARFEEAKEAEDAEAMGSLAAEVFEELRVHTAIEEEIFYPAARGASEELAEVVDEGVEEHHVAKVLMAELADLEAASDQWVAKMSVLQENVEHHAEEEETEMFPPLRNDLGGVRLERLAEQMEGRKAELGAPTVADKAGMTSEQLRGLAREQDIPGRSKMEKDELAATVAPSTTTPGPG